MRTQSVYAETLFTEIPNDTRHSTNESSQTMRSLLIYSKILDALKMISYTFHNSLSHMQNFTQITEEEYFYALECLPPIYPSQLGKEYLTDFVEYDNNSKPWTMKLTGIFQNSEPTTHKEFYTKEKTFITKPVYATYFIHDGKYYQCNDDFQNLFYISF